MWKRLLEVPIIAGATGRAHAACAPTGRRRLREDAPVGAKPTADAMQHAADRPYTVTLGIVTQEMGPEPSRRHTFL